MATKNKTNRSLKKRFKITATGKIKHKKPGKRHLLAGRTSKRKRQLRGRRHHRRQDSQEVRARHGRRLIICIGGTDRVAGHHQYTLI